MKHLISWKAFIIATGEPTKDQTIIDCSNSAEAQRLFYKDFNFNRYRKVKIVSMKGVI